MKAKILTVLAIGLFLGADGKDDAKNDHKKQQGKWMLTSAVMNGTEIPKDQVKGELVFKGNKYSYTTGEGETGGGTFKLDTSKKPEAMDAVPSEGPAKGETVQVIYELDGDNLKICMASPGTKRPKEFKADADSNQWLLTYKRAK